MAILLQDDFNRANNTTVIGSPAVGGPYTVHSGTWGILSNELYLSAPAAGAQVTFPAAVNVDFSIVITVDASNVQMSPMIRWVDVNNFWALVRPTGGQYGLYRYTAGVAAAMGPPFTYTLGQSIGLRAHGDQIAWTRDGVQLGLVTDHWYASAGSQAGYRNVGTLVGRCDNALAQDRVDPLNYWGAAPEAFYGLDLSSDIEVIYTPAMYKGRDTGLADENGIV